MVYSGETLIKRIGAIEKIYCCDRGDNDNMKVIEEKIKAEM